MTTTDEQPDNSLDCIERPSVTEKRTGLTDRQLQNLEKQGLFPKRFKINPTGGRAVGHLQSEVTAWIKARRASVDQKKPANDLQKNDSEPPQGDTHQDAAAAAGRKAAE